KHALAATPIPEIGPALRAALLRHHWPGNIRELENVMRRYLVVRNPEIIADELHRLGSRVAGGNRSASKAPSEAQSRWATGAPSVGGDLFGGPLAPRTTEHPTRLLPSNGQFLHDSTDTENSELVKLDQARKAAEIDV